jgi:hypothetical protein
MVGPSLKFPNVILPIALQPTHNLDQNRMSEILSI